MFVEIITIGDELLIGQIIDTNSAWIGQELNKVGFEVIRRTSVRDREEEIFEAIKAGMERADVVLTTGGLGPTKDDITKKVLCDYFKTKLILNQDVLQNVQTLLSQRNISLIQSNRDQALVPETAQVINNKIGTAPILWFEQNGKVLVAMPGVPQEMKQAMSNDIIPELIKHFASDAIIHHTFLVKNYPESLLAEVLSEWEDNLPSFIKLAYLPQQGIIRLRLTGRAKDKAQLESALQNEINTLFTILGNNIFPEEESALNKIIGDLLRKKQRTLSVAESCTGGAVSAAITALPGSSEYYRGGVIAYSNDLKMNILHVKKETLIKYGAVSEQTATEMVKGAMESMNSDYAIATTGVAGPGGGTKEKPVGTIWIAAAYKNKIITKKLESDRGRESNIIRAVNNVLLLLHDLISED